MPAVFVEVRAHAVFQVARFADVNDFAFGVFVQINARRIGQNRQFFVDVRADFVACRRRCFGGIEYSIRPCV